MKLDGRVAIRRLRLGVQSLGATLWFLPALLVVVSITLAAVLVEVSTLVDDEALARWPRLFGASPDGSRDMLATIAGSVITVTGVTFSIVMVAVTQASAQYTPRILRNFMRDRTSQVVLGGLAGVFTYCLVVLRTIRAGEDVSFVPSIAVLAGFVLAIVSIGLLILFIHHMTSALQASSIIARVTDDTIDAVDHRFPRRAGDAVDEPELEDEVPNASSTPRVTIPSPRAGYIQFVDHDVLMEGAQRLHGVVHMMRGIGEHVIAGMPLVFVTTDGIHSHDDPDMATTLSSLAAAFTIETYRAVEQDPAFGVRQVVDIAVKALSPGINDPTTAINCIDNLAAVLARAAERCEEPRLRRADGELRLIAKRTSFEQLADEGLDGIRHYAEGHPRVLARLLEVTVSVGDAASSTARRDCLLRHIDRLEAAIDRSVADTADRQALLRRVVEARAALEASRERSRETRLR